jgi:hypothetical protein
MSDEYVICIPPQALDAVKNCWEQHVTRCQPCRRWDGSNLDTLCTLGLLIVRSFDHLIHSSDQ